VEVVRPAAMDTVNPVVVAVAVVLMEQHAVVQPVPEHISQVVLANFAYLVPTVQHVIVQVVEIKNLSSFQVPDIIYISSLTDHVTENPNPKREIMIAIFMIHSIGM